MVKDIIKWMQLFIKSILIIWKLGSQILRPLHWEILLAQGPKEDAHTLVALLPPFSIAYFDPRLYILPCIDLGLHALSEGEKRRPPPGDVWGRVIFYFVENGTIAFGQYCYPGSWV